MNVLAKACLGQGHANKIIPQSIGDYGLEVKKWPSKTKFATKLTLKRLLSKIVCITNSL